MTDVTDTQKVIRDTDADSIRLARTLLRTARYGALGVIDPEDGSPCVSRVGVATDFDGTPVILISSLAKHTKALMANGRCSLLLGETGKGDPLAHARITLACNAERLDSGEDESRIRRRYLNHNPKAALYANLGDFCFFRLAISGADLNGGFGRAYRIKAPELTTHVPHGLAEAEQRAVDHMNEDHLDAIQLYASHFGRLGEAAWRICGIDADGLDLAAGDPVGRVFFPSPLADVNDLRPTLVQMAKTARNQT